jgi:hypothetical protein
VKRFILLVWAIFRSRLHCLLHLHRPIDLWIDGKREFCGCECGRNYIKTSDSVVTDFTDSLVESFRKEAR